MLESVSLHRGGASNARLFISFRLPIPLLKEETRREEGKRERERDIERERESEIEETDNKTRTKFWRSMKLGVIYTPGFLRQRQAARRSHQVLSIVFLHKIDGQNLVRSTRLALF